MITGKENIIRFIRFNSTPFWRIRRSEKTEPIADSGDDRLTIDESITRLEQFFNILGPGTYFIESWQTEGQKKMWCKDTIQLLPDNLKEAFVSGMNTGPSQQIDVSEAIARALTDYKTEVEIKNLREENARLQKENSDLQTGIESAFSRIFSKVEPYLGTIMGNKEIASIGAVPASDPDQKRLEVAFELWQKNEPEVVRLVEKIAELANKDKSTYGMARNMLLNT
jgi:hypothetical protein